MAGVDIDALSAREIKERLTVARVDFSDCFEKRELVKRLRDHCRALDDDKVQEVKALANRCSESSTYLQMRIVCQKADKRQTIRICLPTCDA